MANPTHERPPPDVPQFVGDKHVDRRFHVWRILERDFCLCVLCGGVTNKPTIDELPEKFRKLTDMDRALCPFIDERVNKGT